LLSASICWYLSDSDRWNATFSATATNNIYVGETQGDLNIRNIIAGGAVGLSAQASIIDAVDLVESNQRAIRRCCQPRRSSSAGWPGVDITANSITLWAGAAIGSAGNDIDINTTGGTLTAFADGGVDFNLNVPRSLAIFCSRRLAPPAPPPLSQSPRARSTGRTDGGTNIVGSGDPDDVSMVKPTS